MKNLDLILPPSCILVRRPRNPTRTTFCCRTKHYAHPPDFHPEPTPCLSLPSIFDTLLACCYRRNCPQCDGHEPPPPMPVRNLGQALPLALKLPPLFAHLVLFSCHSSTSLADRGGTPLHWSSRALLMDYPYGRIVRTKCFPLRWQPRPAW